MKTTFTSIVTLLAIPLLFAGNMRSQNQATNTIKIAVTDLQVSGIVIGKLSMPLGTVVRLDGYIQTLPDLHPKSDEEFEWLRVDSINGTVQKVPVLLKFRWFGTTEKSSLQGRVSIMGYETGGFVGVPSAAFSHIPVVASTDFHFESFFMVIKKL